MLSFAQEFPFYVFRPSATTVHSPMQCCDGKSQETTLNELAEMLSCSRRHMRTLLNMMESRGWLTWEAEAGRGKRSRLTFLYTGLALQQQRAEDLLEQDRIDQLVQLVGDKAAVRQMLVSHLGRSFRQGRHILRVLYYRPMKNLLPGSAAAFGNAYCPANIQRPDAGK